MANLKKLNINGTAYNLVDAEGRELIKNINDVTIPAINDDVDRVEGKVDTLIGFDSNMSARAIVQDEVAKQLTSENISESFDTLKEMAEYLSSHPEDVTEINNRIKANEDDIKTINDTTIPTINEAIESINSELESLGGGAGSIANQIKGEIEKLDADVTSTGGTNVEVKVTETDGKITAVTITKDESYKKPSTGIPPTDFANDLQGEINRLTNTTKGYSGEKAISNAIATAEANAKSYADGLAGNYATAAQGAKADTAVQNMEVDADSQDYLEIESAGADNTGRAFYLNVADVNSATAKGQGLADAYDVKQNIDAVSTNLSNLAKGLDANFTEVENAYNNLGKKIATATKETFVYDAETETLTITSALV